MNTALIFAGGTGKRMGTAGRPKQFLELHGKPIIIHTLEHFDRHPEIDAIAVVCIAGWIDYLKDQLERWRIKKVRWIVPGGETSQDSTRAGLGILEANCDPENTIVLIHDGVRPLITEKLISDNIAAAFSAVGEKGATLPEVQNSAALVTAVATLPDTSSEEWVFTLEDDSTVTKKVVSVE